MAQYVFSSVSMCLSVFSFVVVMSVPVVGTPCAAAATARAQDGIHCKWERSVPISVISGQCIFVFTDKLTVSF